MSDRDPDAPSSREDGRRCRAQGMQAGAVGLSSGLYYAPGSYSKTGEVVAMAKAMAAQFGGVYSSHIRDEADYTIGVVAAVEEVITDRGSRAGVIGVVTHMKALGPASWGLSKTLVERIEAARARGVQVYADQYPYEAERHGHRRRADAALGTGRRARRDAEAHYRRAERTRCVDDVKTNIARRGGADTLVISRYAPDPSHRGPSARGAGRKAGSTPRRVRARICSRKATPASCRSTCRSDDIEHIMRQPWTMTCTDGDLVPMGQGKPHPRAYGAFPRKLERYVRERGVVDLPFAIRSMTSLPARCSA